MSEFGDDEETTDVIDLRAELARAGVRECGELIDEALRPYRDTWPPKEPER